MARGWERDRERWRLGRRFDPNMNEWYTNGIIQVVPFKQLIFYCQAKLPVTRAVPVPQVPRHAAPCGPDAGLAPGVPGPGAVLPRVRAHGARQLLPGRRREGRRP